MSRLSHERPDDWDAVLDSALDRPSEPEPPVGNGDLAVACPACMVRAGVPCTAPTETGRRVVGWTHSSRHDLARGVLS